MMGQVRGGLSGKREVGCMPVAVRQRSVRPTVAGTTASQSELPVQLADVTEVSLAQASAGGIVRTAPGGKA
jgi:hypothetical protein